MIKLNTNENPYEPAPGAVGVINIDEAKKLRPVSYTHLDVYKRQGYAVVDIAQQEFFVTYELVTRIEVTCRRNSHIFSTYAAAGYSLDDTGAACQVYHVVIECEITSFTLPFPFQHLAGQSLIFRQQLGDVRFPERDVYKRQDPGHQKDDHG